MSRSAYSEIFTRGGHAVITGAASGIGLGVAKACARLGMKVVLADLAGERLVEAARLVAALAADPADIAAIATDVSALSEIQALEGEAIERYGPVHFLMNNAGIQPGSALFGPLPAWEKVLAVNLWGVIHGSRVFGPGMIEHGGPGMIVNTGSKQGITTPPGDPAYNTAKAGVKVFTEALEHELRNMPGCRVSAHLLIPGFVFTPLTSGGRTEKPSGAWTAEQTADFMLESLQRSDFYILCPDNDVSRALDEKRMAWAIGDIIENRPPLSRWHPDFAEAFKDYLTKGAAK
jgi:NAD(P)-dependent dehydrogenase (short-subunit alcohol dehydrogenase family)